MSDWDRYLVIGCMIAVVVGSLALVAPIYVLYARRKQGAPPRQKPVFSGPVGVTVLVAIIFAPIILPMMPAALFSTLDNEELLHLSLTFFFLYSGIFLLMFAPLAFAASDIASPSKTRSKSNWAALKLLGAGLVGLMLLFIASEGVYDFAQPRSFIEGRVDRKWTTMGRYVERPEIRFNGKDHRATWKAYEAATVGWPFRAEVGAGSGRIYRMESTWGGSMRPQQ